MSNKYARIGAVFYVLWGLLHIFAGYMALGALEGVRRGVSRERIMQNSIFLAMTGVASVWIAVKFNWYNDAFGYWFNLFIVSVADISFIWLILLPGYIPLFPGVNGPVLWIIAVVASTIGRLSGSVGEA